MLLKCLENDFLIFERYVKFECWMIVGCGSFLMILVIDEIVDMFVKFCSKELIFFKIILV